MRKSVCKAFVVLLAMVMLLGTIPATMGTARQLPDEGQPIREGTYVPLSDLDTSAHSMITENTSGQGHAMRSTGDIRI